MRITYKGVTKDIKFYKGLKWTKPLTPKMKKFQKETGKNAVYHGVVTGTFEHWMYWRKPKDTPKTKKPPTIAGIIKEQKEYKRLEEVEDTTPKYTKRQLKNLEEWETEVIYYDKRIKEKDKTIDKDILKHVEYYNDKIKRTNDPNIKRSYQRQKTKAREGEYRKLEDYRKQKVRYQNNILAYELEFNKVNKLTVNTLVRKSKWHRSQQVRGYGYHSPGYYIRKPTVDNPKIVIGWNSYQFAKKETEDKDFKILKEKMLPVLEANNIKYKIKGREIIITR